MREMPPPHAVPKMLQMTVRGDTEAPRVRKGAHPKDLERTQRSGV